MYADHRIRLDDLAEDNELRVVADLVYSHTGEGLHRFVDPADDRVYLYSQMEVPDARRVFTTFEQPDLKSVFRFTVTAPSDWVVVSNAPTPEPVAAGRGMSVWAFPRPSACRRTSPRSSPVSTTRPTTPMSASTARSRWGTTAASRWCRSSTPTSSSRSPSRASRSSRTPSTSPTRSTSTTSSTSPSSTTVRWRTPGCVTLRDEYLPRSQQARWFYEQRANTILHEMAHMWFGDLVTMKWWDDLWLNESFAEWASHHASDHATKYDEAWTGFTNTRKNWAYRQDQLPSTHPIAADNHDLEAVEVNFDGITYAKGASSLKQLVAWVGEDEFLAGLRAYFQQHAFGNSEFSDLLRRSRRPPGATWARGPRSGCRPAGSTRWPPSSTSTTRDASPLRGAADRRPGLPDAASRTASASASTTGADGPWSAVPRRDRRRRRAHRRARAGRRRAARPGAAQRRRPDLRQDPPRRAVARDRAGSRSTRSTTRSPGRCAGARCGT